MITQTTNLNLIPYGPPIVIHCDQYDEGTGRLIFNLYENDIAYTPTGTAVIQGTKPDNHGFNYNCTMVGNVVTADLTDQMTPVAGSVRCQIVVTESDGRTGSFAFILEVQKSALPDDTVLSDSDFQLIQQAIQDTAESAEDAEAWAVGERNGVPVTSGDETYHNNAKYWAAQSQVGSLDTLTDVTITAPTDGQVLTYDANSAEWINGSSSGASSLNSLTDVNITTVSDGQALRYDSNSGKWINEAVSDDITNLGGVTISAPTDGQSLVYDSNSGEWINQNVTATTTLSNLTDVSLSTLTDGEVLTYDSIGGKWQNEALTMALPSLSDVTISTPTDGQVLTYDVNTNGWKNAAASSGTLNGLTDVTISTPTDDQVLAYDSDSGEWINQTFSGGGMNVDGSNAAASVGMTGTKQFLVGDRTNKGTAGTYAYEIGDGAEATGYGAYAEGGIDYAALSSTSILSPNTTTETKILTRELSYYPYQSYSLTGTCATTSNWEVTINSALDNDVILTNGDATVRLTQNGTDIEAWFTNTGNTNKVLYYGMTYGNSLASGRLAHAEGVNTTASGHASHSEGGETTVSGEFAHVEGFRSSASGYGAHAEGYQGFALATASHAEGYATYANEPYSHAEGYFTKASSDYQHVSGKFNVEDTNDTYAVIVGNGTGSNARSNAFTVDWSGNICDGTGEQVYASHFTSTVSAIIGDTSATFSDAVITSTSYVRVWFENTSNDFGYTDLTLGTGTATVTFPSLTEATTIQLEVVMV